MITASAVLVIEVLGLPAEQGSLEIHTDWRTGRQGLRHANRNLDQWRKAVAWAAKRAVAALPHFAANEPVIMGAVFRLPRPDRGRPGSRLEYPTAKHDQDKLLRATRDALSGIAYEDDGQVLGASHELPDGRAIGFPDFKRFARDGELPGATIRLARLSDLLTEAL